MGGGLDGRLPVQEDLSSNANYLLIGVLGAWRSSTLLGSSQFGLSTCRQDTVDEIDDQA
jgi:hypothetical protein